jgi:hypothetical protein
MMANTIFYDGTTTVTITDRENVEEEYIWNASTAITIGGVVKRQADSSRLKVVSNMVLTESEYRSLKSLIEDFTKEIFYTPSRLLAGYSTIEQIQVVITDSPKIKPFAYNDGILYEVELEMEEVLSA